MENKEMNKTFQNLYRNNVIFFCDNRTLVSLDNEHRHNFSLFTFITFRKRLNSQFNSVMR